MVQFKSTFELHIKVYITLTFIGVLDEKNSSVTGNNVSFIYPDMETVFLGRFENKLVI